MVLGLQNNFIYMKGTIILIVILIILGFFGFLLYRSLNPAKNVESSSPAPVDLSTGTSGNFKHLITLETNFGIIQFKTYDQDAPNTVKNFITLAQKGFYNNLIFHRIIDGFMIQGGDPKGNGIGGPGYTFADELNPATESYKAGYQKGTVAMANAGPDTNGSQFFIMLKDTPLPKNYTIFGKVVKGQEVVDTIGKVRTDKNDRPLEPVIIKDAIVENIKND